MGATVLRITEKNKLVHVNLEATKAIHCVVLSERRNLAEEANDSEPDELTDFDFNSLQKWKQNYISKHGVRKREYIKQN